MTSVNRNIVLFNFIDYYHYLCADIYKVRHDAARNYKFSEHFTR